MSPNSRAHFSNVASGSRWANGVLPMMKFGLGPGGRSMLEPVYRDECGSRHSALSIQQSAKKHPCTAPDRNKAFNRKARSVRKHRKDCATAADRASDFAALLGGNRR